MNCFESRQEFAAMWRNRATGERRAEILAHLKSCAKCDHAFRVFALTAPVLHSEAEPPALARVSAPVRREFSLSDRPQRFASVSRETASPRRWVAIAAAAAIFVFAGSAAIYSVHTPRETLGEELSMPDSNDNYQAAASDPLAPEMPMTESDLAS
jgi:anti-sigma factor RsiW